MHVVVVGAGAFGGWSALALARRGVRVTLLDAWGPANARASSGDETRVLRCAYGALAHYSEMTARARGLWRQAESAWGLRLFAPVGALFLLQGESVFASQSREVLGYALEELVPDDLVRRYPVIAPEGVDGALLERDAGALLARRACEAVVQAFVDGGGDYRRLAARPEEGLRAVRLSDGTALAADAFVFACGPWLPALFPELLGPWLTPHRQEVLLFGTPPGDARYLEESLPVWVDLGERPIYGIPGDGRRGFKVADDTRGPAFEPTGGDRVLSAEGLAGARAFLSLRFPGLARAPLLEARVCQYEDTPDRELILDRHPAAPDVWLAGGGSGHGFKLAPCVGDLVADSVLGRREVDPRFSLARFGSAAWRADTLS